MKYIKQPKRHIVLDDFEWRVLVKGINEYAEPDSFNNFFDSVYWATVSLTTMGYGDIYPVKFADPAYRSPQQ